MQWKHSRIVSCILCNPLSSAEGREARIKMDALSVTVRYSIREQVNAHYTYIGDLEDILLTLAKTMVGGAGLMGFIKQAAGGSSGTKFSA